MRHDHMFAFFMSCSCCRNISSAGAVTPSEIENQPVPNMSFYLAFCLACLQEKIRAQLRTSRYGSLCPYPGPARRRIPRLPRSSEARAVESTLALRVDPQEVSDRSKVALLGSFADVLTSGRWPPNQGIGAGKPWIFSR